jgi:hypothetical protein
MSSPIGRGRGRGIDSNVGPGPRNQAATDYRLEVKLDSKETTEHRHGPRVLARVAMLDDLAHTWIGSQAKTPIVQPTLSLLLEGLDSMYNPHMKKRWTI